MPRHQGMATFWNINKLLPRLYPGGIRSHDTKLKKPPI
jgi:hypothetical protein